LEKEDQAQQLAELERQLLEERPVDWDSLPDIPLYMDQVVSYLSRQLIGFGRGDVLTPAMVNNYIKDGLVPRAQGKRYGKEHLVYLTLVAAVKQVLSVRDMKALLEGVEEPLDPRDLYESFEDDLDTALKSTREHMERYPGREEDLPGLALSLALRSYADALACRRVVELLRPPEETKKKKGKEENGS